MFLSQNNGYFAKDHSIACPIFSAAMTTCTVWLLLGTPETYAICNYTVCSYSFTNGHVIKVTYQLFFFCIGILCERRRQMQTKATRENSFIRESPNIWENQRCTRLAVFDCHKIRSSSNDKDLVRTFATQNFDHPKPLRITNNYPSEFWKCAFLLLQ